MDKIKRNERVAAMMHTFATRPGHYISLNEFTDRFGAAKSSVSEDISLLRGVLTEFGLGTLETIVGAAGGVKYVPASEGDTVDAFLDSLGETLQDPVRILPGGFLYMTDILCRPDAVGRIGDILAGRFLEKEPDFVVTVETKGIPVAMMTARALNCPLVIARRDVKSMEGSVVTINYVSASSRSMQTMSLPKRAMPPGKRALMVDDFMKGGGTANGVKQLMAEFGASLVGVGVLIATDLPREKKVREYTSLFTLYGVDEAEGRVEIKRTGKKNG